MMMRNKIFSLLLFTFALIFFGGMMYVFLTPVEGQNVVELACPVGSYALGGLTTRNPSTGGIRQYGCVDANGNLSLSNAVAPGGSNTQVQFNNSGVFGGNAGFVYNSLGTVTIAGISGTTNSLVVSNPNFGGANILTTAISPNRGAVTIGGVAPGTIAMFNLSIATVANLPSAASNSGAMMQVSDSTAVAAEGQTCVGSSTNVALAFSNGTVWKCF